MVFDLHVEVEKLPEALSPELNYTSVVVVVVIPTETSTCIEHAQTSVFSAEPSCNLRRHALLAKWHPKRMEVVRPTQVRQTSHRYDHHSVLCTLQLTKCQAFQELQRGERTATALENNLSALERKIEELLASADANEKALEEATKAQVDGSSKKDNGDSKST